MAFISQKLGDYPKAIRPLRLLENMITWGVNCRGQNFVHGRVPVDNFSKMVL